LSAWAIAALGCLCLHVGVATPDLARRLQLGLRSSGLCGVAAHVRAMDVGAAAPEGGDGGLCAGHDN
jgi:hypothetical protein